MKRFLVITSSVMISLSLVLSLLMFFGSDEPFETKAFLETHSYLQMADGETFNVYLLASEDHPMYFETEYIINALITSNDQERFFPIEVKTIETLNQVEIAAKTYYQIRLTLQPIIVTENYSAKFRDAFLEINYLNEKSLSIPIGDFHYYYPENKPSQLFIHRQHVIHETISSIPTSVGLVLGIHNRYHDSIEIIDVHLNTDRITINLGYAKQQDAMLEHFNNLQEWLNYPYDIYRTDNQFNRSLTIDQNEDILLVLPFSYERASYPLFRFPIVIIYQVDNELKEAVIDDFMYINTSRFLFDNPYLSRQIHD